MIRSPKRARLELESSESLTDEAVMTINAPLAVATERQEDASEEPSQDISTPPQSEDTGSKPPKKNGGFQFKVPVPKTKKQWIIAVAIMVLLLGGAGFAVYWFIIRDTTPPVVKQEPQPEPEPSPEPIYSIVTGRELTDKAINDRPIYAVQIENSPEARPQSGLKDADIVSEAVAEGGITRFNAIFHDNIPANIGPVRSLRPYYIDWFLPYDAAIVHAGGSGEALADVRSMGLKDMDSVASIMRRVSGRYSPHNYYTTGQQVLDLAVSRGYKPNVTEPLARKDAAPAEAPTAGTISVKISSALYNVSYTWDKASNTYLRNQGGGKHVDAEDGTQLAPNVVIVPIMNKGIHPDRVHTQYGTVGSGKVYVFQDGTVTEGTWTKQTRGAQWLLQDASGETIKLNRGQTWFTITDAAGNVNYTP